LGSWVNSRNVLRDTTTYPVGYDQIPNLFEAPGGGVDPSVAKFVLQSGDVVTLSVRVLISVPAILLFLFIVQKILGCVLRYSHLTQDPIFDKEGNLYVKGKNAFDTKGNAIEREKGAIALLATQLFRVVNKKINPGWDWKHETADVPFLRPSKGRVPALKHEPDEKPVGIVTENSAGVEDK